MLKFKRFDYEMVIDKYSILFYIRKSKKDPSMGTLYTRLTLNGSMIELCCTGIKSTYADFDTKKQKLKDQEQNKILTQLTSDIIYFIENTPNPTPKSIAFKMSHSLHRVLSHVRQLKVSHYEEM